MVGEGLSLSLWEVDVSDFPCNSELVRREDKFHSLFFPLGTFVVLGTFGSSHPQANVYSLTSLARSKQERIQHWLWNEGGRQNARERSLVEQTSGALSNDMP